MFYDQIVLTTFVLIKAPNGFLAEILVDVGANRHAIGIYGDSPHLHSNQQIYNP